MGRRRMVVRRDREVGCDGGDGMISMLVQYISIFSS